MACPHGSEPRPSAPEFTWISYRDLLDCNGQPGEPWYCNLIPAIPNPLNFKVVADFCTSPQPPLPEYPTFIDAVVNAAPFRLVEIAEHKAWNKLCRCKLPPPPPKQPNLLMPERPDCYCDVTFAYYRLIDNSGELLEIGGGEGPTIDVNSYTYHQFGRNERTRTYGTTAQFREYDSVLYFSNTDPESTNRKENYSFSGQYNQEAIARGDYNFSFDATEPYEILNNFCSCPPIDEPPPPRDPPEGVPPPPDVCCPVKPPDLRDIYEKIAELEARINQLKGPPILGEQSIESPGNPYGIRIRYQGGGG